jgi:hypothetical protein
MGTAENELEMSAEEHSEEHSMDESMRMLMVGLEPDIISNLKYYGHHIDFAENGLTAYELLQMSFYDAVIVSTEISFSQSLIFLQKFR